jgi:two-component system, NtrC family, response regulator HydG
MGMQSGRQGLNFFQLLFFFLPLLPLNVAVLAKILIVEDDITFCKTLNGFLSKHGHVIDIKHNIEDGLKFIRKNRYDLLLIDFRLPDGTGVELLNYLRSNNITSPVIIMTSFIDVRTAVRAMKLGAYDYITKPIIPEELLMVINEALEKKNLISDPDYTEQFIDGTSQKSIELNEYIRIVAPTNISVIIQGESGTGKEQVARKIHRLSKRSSSPFVAIDCGALSSELAASELFGHKKGAFTSSVHDKKGQFEVAQGGTLFLDEIGNLNHEIQVKLLRVLQERVILPVGSNRKIRVDVRIIAAINDDLSEAVRNGSFREDLYHRLNEFKIIVPPLRQRGHDLHDFIEHFIHLSNLELGRNVKDVSKEVLEIFTTYGWPGNLRELKNTIKRAVLLSKTDVLEKELLPDEMVVEAVNNPYMSEFDLKAIQEASEREMIIKTLQEAKYNKSRAARMLNIDRKTLYHKLSRYNIEE